MAIFAREGGLVRDEYYWAAGQIARGIHEHTRGLYSNTFSRVEGPWFEHRVGWGDDEPWTLLGTAEAPPENEVILGAKIWTKLRCQGLSVEIHNLRVDGRMASRQVLPVPVIEDPRSDLRSRP